MADVKDNYAAQGKTVDSVITRARTVTTHNTNPLAEVSRAIWIGGGGDLRVLLKGDVVPVVFKNVAGGTLLPLRVQHVYTTGTTVTSMLVLM